MQSKQLGDSDMSISAIGLGAWAIGGPLSDGWGAQDDKDSIATIHHAVNSGVNWIDTAPYYGLGHSESVVGQAIKGMQNKPYIFTKCGLPWNEKGEVDYHLKAASVRREAEDSLRRLNVEVIDLYQIHWPVPAEDIVEAWEVLAQLQKDGKVRYIGVSNHSVEQMEMLEKIAHITSSQPQYSLLHRECEAQELPWCPGNKTGVIPYSPMASGMLSGKMTRERIASMQDDWRKTGENFTEPKLTRNLMVVDKLREVAAKHKCTVPEVAIAWVLKNPAVTAAITGMRSPAQVDELVGAAAVKLDAADIALIESV